MRAAAKTMAVVKGKVSEFAGKICRTVFGEWGSGKSGAARSSSQNLAVFENPDGTTGSHTFDSRIAPQFARMRAIGIWSLFSAQKQGVLAWLRREENRHILLVQTADDTNVWVRGGHNKMLLALLSHLFWI